MFIWKTIDIGDNERVLVYQGNRFERVLEPGRHRVKTIFKNMRFEFYEINNLVFENKNAKFLIKNHKEKLSVYLEQVELSDTQVGLVYRDQHFIDILSPGSLFVYWSNVGDVMVDIVDISENYEISKDFAIFLGQESKTSQIKELINAISYNEVPDEHVGLLKVNGKLEKILKPGSYGFWKYNRSISVEIIDMRLKIIEVNGQEILTKDRLSLRINLSASYRIDRPEFIATKLNDFFKFIYCELQLRLREVVGTRTLDQLLEKKDSLNSEILDSVYAKFSEYGIVLLSVGVKDIILPGDMKTILNQVVEAQKEAEANLIRRREETQAMRSLHNTAKMIENNPTLLRLKELESLERVTNRIDKISVYNGLDGVLNDLVKLSSK